MINVQYSSLMWVYDTDNLLSILLVLHPATIGYITFDLSRYSKITLVS